jgi:hypothetical protein
MIGSMHVLDVLRERGYFPRDDTPPREGWFDLALPGGTVRAILTPEDGCEIHLFERHACAWSVRFTNAPGAVFLATLDAAEAEARALS